MVFALRTMPIPKYRLIDDYENLKGLSNAHHYYALHFTVATFMTPVYLCNWFLENPTHSMKVMSELSSDDYIEYASSIAFILEKLTTFDINSCVEWAFALWRTIFIDNVIAANRHLESSGRQISRFPASAKSSFLNINFVLAASQLMAAILGIISEEGKDKTVLPLVQQLFESSLVYEPSPHPPEVTDLSTFNDLKQFNKNFDLSVLMKKLSNFNSPKNSINFIPEIDKHNCLVISLISFATKLREFSFTGSTTIFLEPLSYKMALKANTIMCPTLFSHII